MSLIIILLILLAVLIIAALPMHLAVLMLGGRSSIFKVIVANILASIISVLVYGYFHTWTGLISFILMIWLYTVMFHIGFVRALLAWILQFIIAVLLVLLMFVVFGAPAIASLF